MSDTNPLIRDAGSTNPDERYNNEDKWHGTPDWLTAAATAYRESLGFPLRYPGYPFSDSFYRDRFWGLFDHQSSFVVDGVEHWATMPYHDIYPVAQSFAEKLGIELVSQKGEIYRACFVYEFRPLQKP